MPKNLYRRSGIWWSCVTVAGVKQRKSLRTPNLKKARERLKPIIAKAEAERAGEPIEELKTWADAVMRWSVLQLTGLRESTQERYKVSLRMLDPFLAPLPSIRHVTGPRLSDYAEARAKAGASAATIRRDFSVVSRVLQVARRAGWIEADPTPDQKAGLKELRDPVKPIQTRLVAKVLHVTAQTEGRRRGLVDMMRFLWREGCREAEANRLEWHELELDAVPPTAAFGKTKTRSPRVIELEPATVRMLKAIRPPNARGLVFTNREGTVFLQIASRFSWMIKKVLPGKERFRCHDLRHNFAIRALQGKVGGTPWSIYRLSRHLGHSNTKTTEMYAGWLSRAPE